MSEASVVPINDGELDELSEVKRLPFGFAKRFGILYQEQDDQAVLLTKAKVEMSALMEARRFLGVAPRLQVISDDEFDSQLEIAYQRNASETQQLMEDIGNEVDLFSVAEELPGTEDLLESEDDAPIIKLINATLCKIY